MEIIFHAHHATISNQMRERAARAIEKVARRVDRVVDAVVRFEGDGPDKRVEITLHAAPQRRMVAEGRGRYFGPALNFATERLLHQTAAIKRGPKHPTRTRARTAPPLVEHDEYEATGTA